VDAEEISDPGGWGEIDPTSDRLVFRQYPLLRSEIDAVRPFHQSLSDHRRPIRVVFVDSDDILIMQGNHRVYGARQDGLIAIGNLFSTSENWMVPFGQIFSDPGTKDPGVTP